MVGGWLPRRASAELSIFPARGRAVRVFFPGWLHFDMETLILVTLYVLRAVRYLPSISDCAVSKLLIM